MWGENGPPRLEHEASLRNLVSLYVACRAGVLDGAKFAPAWRLARKHPDFKANTRYWLRQQGRTVDGW